MGDMGETFRFMRQANKERKKERFACNIRRLDEYCCKNGIRYSLVAQGTTCLLRIKGKPKIDYYPSTNKWKCGPKIYHGDIISFLNWFEKQ